MASTPARVLNGCTSCGYDFSGVTTFDTHRVGRHEHLASAEHPDGRRCLTEDEMKAKGMRQDKFGRWRGKPSDSPWFKQAALKPAVVSA
jgi:hypothetical protein